MIVLLVVSIHKSRLPTTSEIHPPFASAPDRVSVNQGPVGVAKRVADFSSDEKVELTQKFNEKFKPAIENWCKAYKGRIPFKPEDVTLDKFHSKLPGGFYTFMIGNTTFTIFDSKNGARVFYMMTHDAANVLNSLPRTGTQRDLSVPVNREEVLRMVKADTGVEYKPNQVEIKPTAVACALDGGAFVEVGRQMVGDFELITATNLSFVVAPDGELIAYQH